MSIADREAILLRHEAFYLVEKTEICGILFIGQTVNQEVKVETKGKSKNVLLFLAGIAFAGIVHVLDRCVLTFLIKQGAERPELSGAPYFSTLFFCINLSVYVFLLLFWAGALRRRMLPTRARSYLFASALLMIFYMALRSAKYRLAGDDVLVNHIFWYLYYIPIIFIPTLFLMTCINLRRKSRAKRFDERLLLIPASIMTAAVLTNDLTGAVFLFPWDDLLIGSQGTYVRNFGYYIIVVSMTVEFICGLILLTKINRSFHSAKKVIFPFLFIILMGVLLVMERAFGYYNTPRPFNPPEIVVFCMLGILESCVRSRLIPQNENYTGFYRSMNIPAMISDSRFEPVYTTAAPFSAKKDELAASLGAPIYTDPDTKLFGARLSAGYAFYTEDESELRRLNEQLAEANELLASENELIRAENELKERLNHVESRSRIYSRVSEALLRKRAQLAALLDTFEDGSPDSLAILSRAALMTAYVKRAGSLLLSGEGDAPSEKPISPKALSSAFEESAMYLPYCGISPMAAVFEGESISPREAFLLYTAFEDVCEAVIGEATMLTVSVSDGVMRISADCREAPIIRTEGVRAESLISEGVCFITVRGREASAE